MGRGLSDLQKWMLREALRNRDAGKSRQHFPNDTDHEMQHPYDGTDLVYGEIKARYYKFPFNPPDAWHPKRFAREYGTANFSTKLPHYIAANVAISRAIDRLQRRGLATHRYAGVTLTQAGIDVARGLKGKRTIHHVKKEQA